MSINNDCLYCNKNQTLHDLMIEICPLKVSTVYLFREQTYKGRCVVAYKDHAKELYELKGEELLAFMEDVNKVAQALKDIFAPEKINYGAYSDKLPHLHIHLAPKYTDGADFGSTFVMNPQKTYLTDEEYMEMLAAIRSKLM
ncbi:diadenosine tetraphosphate (Ap4A) HIT family hydrolase [Dysgonomonas sp. PFB1-18]|nr:MULTISPECIES: HIT family protein [unclassified Dysgonomonas]MDH6311240.1 diadenosine tetraphosphate (Ap4A) HIT family hydrolase [Dysgonomonas sp. PF1-14]MDH6341139.1 diadenosine tetraphosphate (Ap4A) HIT family hydrolase [Dysgonomonas sp. PF1-16]MDH6382829.1 diadenosine tetraphosphate (Ap4A) HIT family hydrolase [Dysgonomonas sp. PFB1-18]MDH6400111.1 diadenosine tetraphosphate (Ap4A) HIT family hydrolase [Dysgonomonas sp. PF1-23]